MRSNDIFQIAGDLARNFQQTGYIASRPEHRAIINIKRQGFAHIVRQWRAAGTDIGMALNTALRRHLRHV